MLRKLHEAREEEGFTLIELLVVVIIIGILAAIAIPVFLNQREKAYLRTAESDARNAAIVMESYFSDENTYPASTAWTGPGPTALANGDDVTVSDEVTLTLFSGADYNGVGTFCIEATHTQLATAAPHATYMSDMGGIQDGAPAC